MKTTALFPCFFCLAVVLLSPLAASAQPGTVDASFRPPADLRDIRSIVVQLDGKIVAAGDLALNREKAALARLNPDGSLDPSFQTGAGANGSILHVALQSDGTLLIGGAFTTYDGRARRSIARLKSDGSLDLSFAPGAGVEGGVTGIAVRPDGKIVIVGGFSSVDGVARAHVARLNADGSVDRSFAPLALGDGGGGSPGVALYDTLALPDNKVIIGGSFAFVGGVEQTGVARLRPDGSRDPGFVAPFYPSSVFALARQADGFILTVGDFWSSPGVGIARLTVDGAQDEDFYNDICCAADDPMVHGVVIQEDGKILVCGRNFHVGQRPTQSGVVRLHAHGNEDLTFYSRVSLPAFGDYNTLALQDDGKVLVGGSFLGQGLVPLAGILRLNNDESAGFIKFAAAGYTVNEIDGAATITVRRSGGTRGQVSVHYSTDPGTASPGRDYQPRSGQLVFEDGENLKTFTIPIRADNDSEGAETVRLLLRQPHGGAVLGSPSESVLTITDKP
jgi:uncharacterized delta-60 repeat protein